MESEPVRRIPLTAIGGNAFNPKRQNISFGRWAMPVMAVKMLDTDPLDRKRAVQSLCDYVFDSRRVASKEFESVVPELKCLHKDEDPQVRLKVAECFGAIAASAAGRYTFENHDFYGQALNLVDDEDEDVRYAAFTALHRVALSPIASESLVCSGAIEILIKRIPQEPDTLLVPLLQALHFCCLWDPDEAIRVNGLKELVPLLERPCPEVRKHAANVIKDLTIDAVGRAEAIEQLAVPPLVELCFDEDDRVKAKAMAALMMIANATEGKYKALECDAIEKLIPLQKSEAVEVRLNAIKVLTALGEAPEGREELQKYHRMILRLRNDDYGEVRHAASKLIKVVTFKP